MSKKQYQCCNLLVQTKAWHLISPPKSFKMVCTKTKPGYPCTVAGMLSLYFVTCRDFRFKFQCPLCEVKYKSRSGFNSHRKLHVDRVENGDIDSIKRVSAIHRDALTTSSDTTSTRLQYTGSLLQWAAAQNKLGYNEFSLDEQLASIRWVALKTSLVRTSRSLLEV